MTRWICLLRGVNVVGSSVLRMKDLASSMTEIGLADVETYIQSGNFVFTSRATKPAPLAAKIRRAISSAHGVDPDVMLLTTRELQDAIDRNPFPDAAGDPKSLHVFFLGGEPIRPDLKRLEERRAGSERFALLGKVFYLHTPDGFARSKLRAVVEPSLGVRATARNWRSACAIRDLAARGLEGNGR